MTLDEARQLAYQAARTAREIEAIIRDRDLSRDDLWQVYGKANEITTSYRDLRENVLNLEDVK